MVSIKQQRSLIVKQKKLLEKITTCQRTGKSLELDAGEIDTVERALLCHNAVIVLDMHKREKKDEH